jgi:uncharacterized LabA/DUF88 family protein
MFYPKTERIKQLFDKYPSRIDELKKILDKPTNMYIDFANVYRWQERLGWHIDLERLKQFLDSFDTIRQVKFYSGTLEGDGGSEKAIEKAKHFNYIVVTKPVKKMRLSIDVSSISAYSPEILKQFVRATLLQKLNIQTIEFLNARLKELNQQGVLYLEDRKCNFDVEIGVDMLLDCREKKADNFILWSGDSDFAGPLKHLLSAGNKVFLFATARKVSTELNDLRNDGLLIFDVQKIRNFICRPKEIQDD